MAARVPATSEAAGSVYQFPSRGGNAFHHILALGLFLVADAQNLGNNRDLPSPRSESRLQRIAAICRRRALGSRPPGTAW